MPPNHSERGSDSKAHPADETASCRWRSALIFASTLVVRRKNQLSARGIMVTYSDLIQTGILVTGILVVAIISLFIQVNRK